MFPWTRCPAWQKAQGLMCCWLKRCRSQAFSKGCGQPGEISCLGLLSVPGIKGFFCCCFLSRGFGAVYKALDTSTGQQVKCQQPHHILHLWSAFPAAVSSAGRFGWPLQVCSRGCSSEGQSRLRVQNAFGMGFGASAKLCCLPTRHFGTARCLVAQALAPCSLRSIARSDFWS